MLKQNSWTSFLIFLFFIFCVSCRLYEKELDNPVDQKADNVTELPALVFYPKSQTKTISDTIKVESFIVFKEDSLVPFSIIELSLNYDNSILELDTIIPGLFITDTSSSTPLFVYNNDSAGRVELFAYFLDEVKLVIEGTGHLADLKFHPKESGVTTIDYELGSCLIYDNEENLIELKGTRLAEVTIQ